MNCSIGSRTIVICFELGITLRISGDQSTWFVKMSGLKSVCNTESTDQVRSTYSLMIPNCNSFWRFCLRNGPPNTHLFLFSGRANNFFWAFGIEKIIKLEFRYYSDVGDFMIATDLRCWWQKHYIIVVTSIFYLQHRCNPETKAWVT